MLLNIFWGATSILIIHNVFKSYCPTLYQKLLILGIYNTVYAYSNVQIVCANLYNSRMYHNDCFEFIENGEQVLKIAVDADVASIIPTLKQNEPLYYDFILYEHECNTIMYLNIPITLEYIESNISFISFTVYFNDATFNIYLSNKNQYNYYIVNNIINKAFLIYYFNHFLHIYCDDFTFEATIIDHNVNIIYFNEKDCIIINKDDYTLIKDDVGDIVDIDDEIVSEGDSDKSEKSYDLL